MCGSVLCTITCFSLSCLSHDINCLEATRLLILELLAKEGNYEEAAIRISDLIQLLDRFEPKNHALYHDMALAFARLVSQLTALYSCMPSHLYVVFVHVHTCISLKSVSIVVAARAFVCD